MIDCILTHTTFCIHKFSWCAGERLRVLRVLPVTPTTMPLMTGRKYINTNAHTRTTPKPVTLASMLLVTVLSLPFSLFHSLSPSLSPSLSSPPHPPSFSRPPSRTLFLRTLLITNLTLFPSIWVLRAAVSLSDLLRGGSLKPEFSGEKARLI